MTLPDGITFHSLIKAFEAAKSEAAQGDEFAGDPSKWPDVRGIRAVAKWRAHRSSPVPAAGSAPFLFTEPSRNAVKIASRAASRSGTGSGCSFTRGAGHFNNILGSLRTMEVVDYPAKGCVQLCSWMLDRAA